MTEDSRQDEVIKARDTNKRLFQAFKDEASKYQTMNI
ncbi:hypothetical protein L917_04065 [Phytophthora nicotianae]|uniref:Uncharacterized protein n=3 Tax=Phytophthora nicotianae TaxID=4792 RepID=V9FN55_PHYNI|nr:hypothetical protein F443_04359 [Phytophthora nicotianae P1569]ETK85433.1 hypothetical protein L915_09748 [Phytophthora nicotianae]ETO68684.1 hypothetical protein F444_14518 [Phytophthora nicotianae P1976]ETL38862.1 hypothetical protein L916_09654 [Phytophthora nicotianae]ETL98964.1 hypothetical protein L917_04065 [Phytophthora nicotianae]